MALKIQMELPSGITGEYLKVNEVIYNTDSKVVHVKTVLYKDELSRTEGKPYIEGGVFKFGFKPDKNNVFDFDVIELEKSGNNIIKQAYVSLKKIEKFKDAEDC